MPAPPALRRLLGDLRPGEGRVCAWGAAYFFCLLAGYYCLRPLRDSYGSERPELLHWLFTGTFVVGMLAQPLYGRLVSRHGRARIVPWAYRFLAANSLVFGLLLGRLEGDALWWAKVAFFVWLSVFNVFAVSILGGFLVDLFGSRRVRRIYGLVAIGGTVGQFVGANSAWQVAGWLGEAALPVLAVVFLELAVRCARRVERVELAPEADEERAGPRESVGGGAWEGLRHVGRSPYLLGICGYVVVYVFGSTLLYAVSSVLTNEAYPESVDRTRFFGRVDAGIALVTLAIQLFATGRVLRRFGLAVPLAAVPIAGVLGFGALGVAPVLAVVVALTFARRAFEFGFSKPAREALYTVVPREDKYKAKAVVDVAVYRGGDLVAMWGKAGLTALGLGVAGVAWTVVPIAGVGVGLAVALGREHGRRERERAGG